MVIDPMDEDRRHIREAVHEGMPVVAADGEKLGDVAEVVGEGFRVNRRLRPDVDVPFDAVRIVNDDGILLSVQERDLGGDELERKGPYTRPPRLS